MCLTKYIIFLKINLFYAKLRKISELCKGLITLVMTYYQNANRVLVKQKIVYL